VSTTLEDLAIASHWPQIRASSTGAPPAGRGWPYLDEQDGVQRDCVEDTGTWRPWPAGSAGLGRSLLQAQPKKPRLGAPRSGWRRSPTRDRIPRYLADNQDRDADRGVGPLPGATVHHQRSSDLRRGDDPDPRTAGGLDGEEHNAPLTRSTFNLAGSTAPSAADAGVGVSLRVRGRNVPLDSMLRSVDCERAVSIEFPVRNCHQGILRGNPEGAKLIGQSSELFLLVDGRGAFTTVEGGAPRNP